MISITKLLRRNKQPNHKWLDDPEDWDGISGLPQVAEAARLIIDPTRDAQGSTSFVGGEPCLPIDVPWPEADGKPMGFVMQLDCAQLPEGLWGGLGPRDGYLSVFVSGDWTFAGTPLRIIHHNSLGPSRPTPSMPIPQWRRNAVRGPKVAIRIAAWPTTHRERTNVGPTPDTCFQDIEDMVPLTWGQAVELLEALADQMGRRTSSKTLAPEVKADDPARPGENTHLSSARDTLKLRRSALARVLWLYRMARRAHPDAELTETDRQKLAFNLKDISLPSGTQIDLRPGNELYGSRIKHSDLAQGLPKTLGELRSFFSDCSRAWQKAAKDVATRCRVLEDHVGWCADAERFVPTEDVPDYDRTELARVTQQLQTDLASLRDFREEAEERLSWLEENRNSLDLEIEGGFMRTDPRLVPHKLLKTAEALRIAACPEIEHYSISDAFYPIWARNNTPQAVLAPGTSQMTNWSHLWHRTTAQLALENPEVLPDALKGPLTKWLSAKLAVAPHQMGGVPRRDCCFNTPWFCPVHYVSDDRRRSWLADDGNTKDGTPKYLFTCDPPFDGENALALHLFSDVLLDWHWGDGYTILFAIPFSDLRSGNFENVEAEVSN